MIQTASEPIAADRLYTPNQIEACVGLGRHSLRRLRREGLPVRYLGGCRFHFLVET